MKDEAWPPPHSADSPSKAGITVLRRASTRPSGEPKRKKPETLKSRRPALMGPSSASEVAVGGQEAVLARLGSPEEEAVVGATCRLRGRGAQCGCLHSPEQGQGRGERAGMSPVLRALRVKTGHVAGGALGGQGGGFWAGPAQPLHSICQGVPHWAHLWGEQLIVLEGTGGTETSLGLVMM